MNSKERKLIKGREKAKRAYRLSLRGHSLLEISKMCNIPSGSVQKRIDLGKRLIEANL
jgi:DNA-directed RNA polymerase specialized sigma24 family protein